MNWLKEKIEEHYAKVYTDQFLQGEQMKFLKTHWPTLLHIAVAGVLLIDPGVRAILSAHPKYAGIGLVVWAEIMHWAQSPNQAPPPPVVQ